MALVTLSGKHGLKRQYRSKSGTLAESGLMRSPAKGVAAKAARRFKSYTSRFRIVLYKPTPFRYNIQHFTWCLWSSGRTTDCGSVSMGSNPVRHPITLKERVTWTVGALIVTGKR